MLPIDLTEKTALITGASGELGRVMARTLARAGAKLHLHYHRGQDRAKALAAELEARGTEIQLHQADISEEAEVRRMANDSGRLGPPDIVVLNAVAQIHPWSSVLEESLEDFDSQYRSCVLQAVLCAKAFAPAMQERSWGRIVGINTECSMQLFETYAAYAAGKRGMDGVLRVLARELGGSGITVNQVAPGWTRSDKDKTTQADDAEYCERVPLRRRGTDQEIANVVAFLASDLSSYITGAFVPVCGGNVMPSI